MKELTREQKKIFYIALIVALALGLFYFLIYSPQNKKGLSIKRQLRDAEAEIARINQMISGRDLKEAMQKLNTQLGDISGRLFIREEDLLRELALQAKKFKLEVKKTDAAAKVALPDKAGKFTVEELPVAMELSGEFRSLGEFLHSLSRDFKGLVSVRQIDIEGAGEGQYTLSLKIKISGYILRE